MLWPLRLTTFLFFMFRHRGSRRPSVFGELRGLSGFQLIQVTLPSLAFVLSGEANLGSFRFYRLHGGFPSAFCQRAGRPDGS